jgi:hypothetical protein
MIDLTRVDEPQSVEDFLGEEEVLDEEVRRLYRSYGWIVVLVMTLVLVEAARLVWSVLT